MRETIAVVCHGVLDCLYRAASGLSMETPTWSTGERRDQSGVINWRGAECGAGGVSSTGADKKYPKARGWQ